MIGLLCGLGAAFCWGIGDFLARFAGRRTGVFRAYFYAQLAGLALLSPLLGLWPIPIPTLELAGLAGGLALVNTIAALLLYRALATGVLAVVSPIASSGNAIAVLLALLTGEQPTGPKLFGIGLTLIGVLLASTDLRLLRVVGDRRLLTIGAGEAMIAALLFGLSLWAIQFPIELAGAVWTTWLLRVLSIGLLVGLALPLRHNLRPPPLVGLAWVIPVGLFDAGAFLAYNIGLTSDFVAIVAVLASLFSAVTVLLAWGFLRERLAFNQWLGVALILIGVVPITLP
jgi:drug/metabolite transporter (DMT)-like permease